MTQKETTFLSTRKIPDLSNPLNGFLDYYNEPLWKNTTFSFDDHKFACVSMAERKLDKEFMPTLDQLMKNPLALVSFVPKDVALFFAGAIAGASSKIATAPLDRIKFLMQVVIHFLNIIIILGTLKNSIL